MHWLDSIHQALPVMASQERHILVKKASSNFRGSLIVQVVALRPGTESSAVYYE